MAPGSGIKFNCYKLQEAELEFRGLVDSSAAQKEVSSYPTTTVDVHHLMGLGQGDTEDFFKPRHLYRKNRLSYHPLHGVEPLGLRPQKPRVSHILLDLWSSSGSSFSFYSARLALEAAFSLLCGMLCPVVADCQARRNTCACEIFIS